MAAYADKLADSIGQARHHAFSVGTDASKFDAMMDWCEKQNDVIRYLLGEVERLEERINDIQYRGDD